MLGIFVKKHVSLLQGKINQAVIFYNIQPDICKTYSVKIIDNDVKQIEISINKNTLLKKIYIIIGFYKAVQLFNKQFGKPSLLHLHALLPLAPIVWVYKTTSRIPLVFTEHWTGYQDEDGTYKGFFRTLFISLLVKSASAGIVVSEHLAKAMNRKELFFKHKVISNAVDISIFSTQLKQVNQKQFIHVSSFDERQKNVLGILEAFKIALNKIPDLKLILVGPKKNSIYLQEKINNLQIENNAFLTGAKTGTQLSNLIKNSAAFILFSNYENQPVVVLESLCCGTPVITSPVGALPEIVNKQNGILITPKDTHLLSEQIIQIAENKIMFNPDEIRNTILKIVDPKIIVEQHLNLYQSILNSNA